MRPRPTLDLHLSGDIDNLLRGLAVGARSIPAGEYRDGYESALTAVAVALGVPPEKEPEPEPRRISQVFDGIEDVPWAIQAFARMGG